MTHLTDNAITSCSGRQYARREDFCEIFIEEVDALYQLSFLLTGDRKLAEQCFVSGLQSCHNNLVFAEWARAWAKRIIIQNAVCALEPCLAVTSNPARQITARTTTSPACFDVELVLELPLFARFVFVLSVLEQYSDQDCALLLQCTREEVRNARVSALDQLASSCVAPSEAAV